jgi:restriction system protein
MHSEFYSGKIAWRICVAIPDYESLMLPFLRLAAQDVQAEVSTREAAQILTEQFRLTDEERTALLPSGGSLVFPSRVSWACTYLKKAGLLVATRRGYSRITARGLDVVKASPKRIDNEFLDRFAEFREFRARDKKSSGKLPVVHSPVEAGVPEEVIASQYELQRKALAAQLLETVKKASPQFFEHLVVTLLVKMGYGGSLQDAGTAVGRSGDGGIDGVIKEDKLGLDTIYLQAKRWDDKAVGSPQIDQFAGALQKKKARKGVFITTSTFTGEALRSVADYSARLVLIDGPALAELMIDHDVGVSVTTTYQLKRIDSDFFDEGYNDA